MIQMIYLFASSVFLFSQTTWANPVEASYNLSYHTVIRNTQKSGTPVYADIQCNKGEAICHFTKFNLGKVDSYDPLIPGYMDDDVEAINAQDISIVYQTGEILFGDQVVGRANEIVYDSKRTFDIHFTIPLTVDREARTLVFGK
jgi:hypothetical protein